MGEEPQKPSRLAGLTAVRFVGEEAEILGEIDGLLTQAAGELGEMLRALTEGSPAGHVRLMLVAARELQGSRLPDLEHIQNVMTTMRGAVKAVDASALSNRARGACREMGRICAVLTALIDLSDETLYELAPPPSPHQEPEEPDAPQPTEFASKLYVRVAQAIESYRQKHGTGNPVYKYFAKRAGALAEVSENPALALIDLDMSAHSRNGRAWWVCYKESITNSLREAGLLDRVDLIGR